MPKNKEKSVFYGIKGENYFASLLNKVGIPHEFTDEWFDFTVNKKFKVEVKSCQLCVKNGKANLNRYIMGRFDFTKEENREKQFEENIWVAFVLRNDNDFMLLGLCQARELNKRRYLPLSDLRKIKLVNFEQWLKKINR